MKYESKNFNNVYTTQDKNILEEDLCMVKHNFPRPLKTQEDNIPYQLNQIMPLEPSAPNLSGAKCSSTSKIHVILL